MFSAIARQSVESGRSVRLARQLKSFNISHRLYSILPSSNPGVNKSESHRSSSENGLPEADYFLDGRLRVEDPFKKPIFFTDKPVEKKIVYSSLAHSFRDCSPFMERVKKLKKIAGAEPWRKIDEMQSKQVDSIVAKLVAPVTSSDTSDNTNKEHVEEIVAEQKEETLFPYRVHPSAVNRLKKLRHKLASDLEELEMSGQLEYGTENAEIPPSHVPCGGCGALLHCKSAAIPGYLPSEVFTACDKHGLRGQICQRCRFLREHNVALNVQVRAEDYPR